MMNQEHKKTTTMYRFDRAYHEDLWDAKMDYSIKLKKFSVVKVTPQGFWIIPREFDHYIKENGVLPSFLQDKQKFVLNHQDGERCKRFAYRTEIDAFRSFKIRSLKAVGYAKSALINSIAFIEKINEHELSDKPINLKQFEITNNSKPQES